MRHIDYLPVIKGRRARSVRYRPNPRNRSCQAQPRGFGAWKAFPLVTILACWGALIVGAVYMLRAVRAVLHGPVPDQWAAVNDAPHLWRKAPFILLLACLLVFGCFPRLLTDKIQWSVGEKVLVTTPSR